MRRRDLLILALLAGCKRDAAPEAAPAVAPNLPPPLARGPAWRLDAGPQTPCTANAPCEARVVLTALGSFKVNREYPFKFVTDAAAAPGVTVEGTGSFAFDDAKTGTLTIRYRTARPGPGKLAGTMKLSVCNDDQCEIEQPKIELPLAVTQPQPG